MNKIITASILSASLLLAGNTNYNNDISLLIGGVHTEGNLDLDRNYADAGLSLGINLKDSFINQVEIGFLHSLKDVGFKSSNEDTSVLRVFINVVKDYPISSNSSLYSLVGLGLEKFSNEDRNKNSVFGNYGFGYKYKLSDTTALKFDLRHVIETDHADNNLLYTAGLSFSFGKNTSKTIIINEEVKKEVKKVIIPVILDDDKDGIINENDRCLNTPQNVKVGNNGCIKSVNLKINFKSNSDQMSEDYSSKLEEFAQYLKLSNKKVVIAAYSDSRGNDKYNLKLSQKRANRVYNALLNLGVDRNNIKALGYGERDPIADNNTKEGRLENRRIEVLFTK